MSNASASFALTHRIRDRCLCLHAQRAARTLSRTFDRAFRPLGITSGQFSLLNSLNRPDPPTITCLSDLLGMDRSTVTANLKPLARDGLVEICTDVSDRRGRRLALTEAGRRVLADACLIWEREHASIERGVEGDALRAALLAIS